MFFKTCQFLGEHTIKYQKHIPDSIGAKLVCIDLLCLLLFLKVKIVLINLSHGY